MSDDQQGQVGKSSLGRTGGTTVIGNGQNYDIRKGLCRCTVHIANCSSLAKRKSLPQSFDTFR